MRQSAREHAEALQFLRFAQLLLERFALRDVPRDVRGPDDDSRLVAHRRHGNRDVDLLAILAHPDSLEVTEMTAAPDALDDVALLVEAIGGEQHPDRLPDRLRCGTACGPSSVPTAALSPRRIAGSMTPRVASTLCLLQ